MEIHSKFNKYYDMMDKNVIHYVAGILDPRIKAHYLKANHPDGDTLVDKIKAYIHEVYGKATPQPAQQEMDEDSAELSFEYQMLMVYIATPQYYL